MNKILLRNENRVASVVPALRGGGVRGWQRWSPYAAIAWSLAYAALGVYWAVSERGFPFTPETISDGMGPLLGRFGPDIAWMVVIMAGIPAATMGAVVLRGARSRVLRSLLIIVGVLLTGVLLLLMTGLDLLVLFGYIPYTIRSLFLGDEISQVFLKGWTQWTMIHQLICLIGGFLWLGATVRYTRLSGRWSGGLEKPEPSRALGAHLRVRSNSCTNLLHLHPLCLGTGVPVGDE